MLMDKASIWWVNTPFRKWFLNHVTKKYYSDYFNELENKTILEIGCGSGFGAEIIYKHFSPRKIVAIDLDQRLIDQARKNVQKKEIVFERVNATKLKFKNKSFDAIFDYGVIHHIPSPEWKTCLNEVYRVLKPGGRAFLYDLSIESFKKTLYGRIIKITTAHPYEKMYKKQEFIRYLISIGFKIAKKFEEPRYFTIIAEKLEYN